LIESSLTRIIPFGILSNIKGEKDIKRGEIILKKIRIILAFSILVFSLTACGKGGEKAPEPTNKVSMGESNEPTKIQEASEPKESKEDASSAYLPLTAAFPMYRVYIDGPNYHFIELGSTCLYNVAGNRFIAITSSKYVEANKTDEILDAYFKEFKDAVDTNCNGYIPEMFNVKESEEIEINGINFLRFEGELLATISSKEKGFYAVGYTFMWEDRPFQLVGVVVSEEQEQKDIDEITKYVDAMVKTIRDKR
jgi:hypothetical protein